MSRLHQVSYLEQFNSLMLLAHFLHTCAMHHMRSSCQINLAFRSFLVFLLTVPRQTLFSRLANIWSLYLTTSINSAYLNKCHNCTVNSWFIFFPLVNLEKINLPLTGGSWWQSPVTTTERPANGNSKLIEKTSDNLASIFTKLRRFLPPPLDGIHQLV